jgi:hypothetical protein
MNSPSKPIRFDRDTKARVTVTTWTGAEWSCRVAVRKARKLKSRARSGSSGFQPVVLPPPAPELPPNVISLF